MTGGRPPELPVVVVVEGTPLVEEPPNGEVLVPKVGSH